MNAAKKKTGKYVVSSPEKRPLIIRHYPDSLLRQKSDAIENFDGVLFKLTEDMKVFMKENRGIGLAAPQVGILKDFFVADIGGCPICLINPKIVDSSGEDKMVESCLSLPEYSREVKRSTQVTVTGFDLNGKEVVYEVKGLLARVFQHEMDHLRGVLICDYAPLKRSKP